ncbi:Ig-like domain-containing protein [Variovorax sp. J22P271]|uniref:Ig-like domain-containing protein n=1 Tax=Variovorax davisae TaxID=3053515 RepID=UPI002578DA7A|nr:Ig-like domain-containing protein [Variovorax sp. J22P271]MDM0037070.1 Ig-like domain-containing protein [Variovorax sp. J22P271]
MVRFFILLTGLGHSVAKKKTAVVINKNGKKAGDPIALDGATPLKIKALPNVKYLLKGDGDVGPENATLTRVGNDLHVTLEGEASPALVLEGFYALAEPSGIYGVAEDGQLYAYGRTDGGDIFSLADGQMAPIALAGDPVPPGPVGEDDRFAFWPLLLGGAALAGLVAAASGGGSDGVEPVVVKPPEPSQKPTTSGIDRVNDNHGDIQGPIANGGVTDDESPEFTGRGESGNTITITDKDGSVIGTTTVKPDGSWSVTPDKPLTEGSHSVTVTETDKNGNTSDPSDPFVFAVDTEPPAKPVLGEVIDSVDPVTGTIPPGGETNDRQPEFTGKGEPGSVITVTDGGELLGTAEVDEDGKWSFTPKDPLEEGPHSVVVTETDKAGNKSEPSDPFVFEVDIQKPGKPVLGEVIDSVDPVTGIIPSGGETNDRQPEFTGKGEPGSVITVIDGGELLGTAEVDEDGKWSFTPKDPLDEGPHSVVVTETDKAGNESAPSDPFVFKVDVSAPIANLGGATDSEGAITGPIANGGLTDDAHPEFFGKGEPGNVITITNKTKDGTAVIGSTTVDPQGNWTFTPKERLPEGLNSITVVETDKAGNESKPTPPLSFEIDTDLPHVGKGLESVIDNVGDIIGPIKNGGVTDDTQPEFIGTGEPGSVITVIDNGKGIGSALVDPNGNWSFTPDDKSPLGEGAHKITITETDKAGNTSEPSDPFDFSVDLTPPDHSKLKITGVEDNIEPVTGNVASGGTTDDSHPLVKGTGTAGDTIIVSVTDVNGTRELGRALVNDDGSWSLQVSGQALASGNNTFTAIERDPAGNKTPPSDPYTVTVDIAGPNAPVIENVRDDVGEGHFLQKGEVTNDDTPTIIGTAEPKSLVKIYDGSELLGSVQADDNGKWEFTAELKDGPHSITATATDAAGQVSAPTGPWGFSVDTQAPAAVDDLKVIDDAGDQTGDLKNGDTTDDSTPTFKGTAEPGGVVTIYDGKTELGSVKADDEGQWAFTPKEELDDGPHSFTTVVTDPAGNKSEPSPELKVTVDTSKVVVSITVVVDNVGPNAGEAIDRGGVTDDPRPVIVGKGKPGSIVTVYDGTEVLGSATVNSRGEWSVTPDKALGNGQHGITAVAKDGAGNLSAPTEEFQFRVDTEAPSAPVIGSALDDVGPKQDPLKSGDTTDDPSPTLKGTAEPGSIVTVYDKGEVLGSVQTSPDGSWIFTPTTRLPEGEHVFTTTATDEAGNVSGPSEEFKVITDYTPPDASKLAITGVDDNIGGVTGNVAAGATTDDSQPLISGTGTAGDVVVVSVTNGRGTSVLGSATVDANGKWTLQVGDPLPSGSNVFTAVEFDLAGNRTDPSAGYQIVVDITQPDVPVIVNVRDDEGPVHDLQKGEVTNDNTPTIIGTSKPLHVIHIFDGKTELGSVTADANGDWVFTTQPLGDGPHDITATATNPVGQTSLPTGVWNFSVDTKAPASVDDLRVIDDEGDLKVDLKDGDTTDDATPTFKGTAEPGSVVTVYDGETELGSAKVDDKGEWEFTPSKGLEDGPHNFTTVVTDPAGNESAPSPEVHVVLDTAKLPVSIGALVDNFGDIQGNVKPNGVTDDVRPEIQGKGKPGSTIEVFDGAERLGTTQVNPDGTWRFTPDTDLVPDGHSITVKQTDASGNVSQAGPFNFSIDTEAPAAPTIDSVTDDVNEPGPDGTRVLTNGGSSNDPTPTLKGKAEPGSLVTVYDKGEPLGSVQAGENGDWSFTPTTPLPEGEDVFTAKATDEAGNVSGKSDEFKVVTDYSAPGAPVIVGVEDDVAPLEGPVVDGGSTNDNSPTISGTGGVVGEKVVIYDNGVKIGEAEVKPGGSWSFTPGPNAQGWPEKLDDKAHKIEATNADAAGNESAKSNPFEFTVDTKAPEQATTIEGVYDDVAADGSVLAVAEKIGSGGYTNDETPQLRGTLSDVLGAGEKVVILRDGKEIGTATVDGTGKGWTFDDGGLKDGDTYIYTARVEDAAGNRGGISENYIVRVDTSVPTQKPTIDGAYDDVAADGSLLAVAEKVDNGGATNDTQPELRGSLQSGLAGNEKVAVYRLEAGGAKSVFVGYANVSGTSWTLVDEKGGVKNATDYTYTARVEDAAGNEGPYSDDYKITIKWDGPDTEAKITGVNDDEAPVTGPVANDGWTNDETPQLVGTLDKVLAAGEKVVILRDGKEIGTATVDGTGKGWTFDDSDLKDGQSYVYKAVVKDAAGNAGADSNTWTINVDLTPPSQEVVLTQIVDNQGDKQDPIKSGGSAVNTIDDDTPRLEGTISKPLSGTEEVHVFRNGVYVGKPATIGADGLSWSYQDAGLSNKGSYDYEARVVDAAGNASDPSNSLGFRLDIDILPVGVSILQVIDDVVPGVEAVLSGGTTNDDTPLLKGAVTVALGAGDVVEIYRDDVKIGTATVTGTTWEYQDSGLKDERACKYEARVVNVAGNNVGESNPFVLNFDKTPPPATAPIESYRDDFAPQTGDFLSGSTTNDQTPLLAGRVVGVLGAGEVVVVYRDGKALGNATVTGATWTYQDGGLEDGKTYEYTTRVEDAGGNQGEISNPFTLTVDTTVPGAPVIGGVEDNIAPIEGPVVNGGSTNDNRPTISGTGGTAGEKVYVYDNGVKIGEADVQPDGSWSFTPGPNTQGWPEKLDDKAHKIEATNVDAAGNESVKSNPFEFTVDTKAPTQSATIDGAYDDVAMDGSALAVAEKIGNGGYTNDPTPQLKGRLEGDALGAGEKVVILRDGDVIGTATVAANGKDWTFDDGGLIDGNAYIYEARVEDAAGNRGGMSEKFVLNMDTSVPTQKPTIDSVWDNVAEDGGVLAVAEKIGNGGYTNDSQPELRGTLQSGLAGNEKVAVYRLEEGGTQPEFVGYANVNGTSWTLVDQHGGMSNHKSYTYTARVEDAAHNVGPDSDGYGIKLELDGSDTRVFITAVKDDELPGTADVPNNGWTNDTTPRLVGNLSAALAAGEKVVILRDGVEIGTATVDGTSWAFDDSGLENAHDYTYKAVVKDGAGNPGVDSNSWTIRLDTDVPQQEVVLTQIVDNKGDSQVPVTSGSSATNTIDDDTPRLEGTISLALSGTEEVRIFRNGADIGKATMNADGKSWWYQDAGLGNLETYDYVAYVVDAASNASEPSNSLGFKLDINVIPQGVQILQVLDNEEPVTGSVLNDGTTNDDTPLLKGSVSMALGAGEVVEIYRDSVKIGTATVTGTTWEYQDSGLSVERAYNYEARVVNAAGNITGKSDPFVINFDKSPPPATAEITGYHDDFAPQTGDFLSGSQTNDTTPLLKGTVVGVLSVGEVVVVYRDGVKLGNAVVAGSGWTYQDRDLEDGKTYEYTARVEDAGGNQGKVSDPFTLTVDTTVPGAPVIGGVEDDVAPITGPVAVGGSTNDNRPTISGTGGVVGEKVVIYDNGVKIGEAEVQPDGSWSFTPGPNTQGWPEKLDDKAHKIEATNVDAAGNESAKSNLFEFTVDTRAPEQATTIEGVYDDVAADGSALAVAEKIGSGGYTNDETPQLRGTLSDVLGAGEKVVILRDGKEIGTATVNGTGWTFDDSGLADGKTYIYEARVEDAAGNQGGVSQDYTVRVDMSAPTQKPAIDSVWDDVNPATGVVANDGTTNDTQPELRGSLQGGLAGNEKVAVYRLEAGGAEVFVGYANVSGTSWTLVDEKGGVKNDTAYTYTARVEDAAGNVGPVSDGYKITMLWEGPDTWATITAVNDDQAPVTGPVANDGWTNDKTPQLVGTLNDKLAAGEKVVILRDGVEIGTATIDGTGQGWTYDDGGLDDGQSYVYKAVVKDAAGNAGSDSNTWTLHVDLTPPPQDVVLTQIVDNKGDKQVPIKSGGSADPANVIDDDTPRLEGTISKALSGTEEVHVFRNGVDIGKATTGADGLSWSYDDASLSNGGKYDYVARVVDAAGNASDPSNGLGFTLNTDNIVVGVSIQQVIDDKAPGLEAVLSGGTTNDDTPLLKGSVTVALGAGEVVEIYRDGVKLGNATLTGTTWEYQDSGLAAERAYSYEARVVNVAGNNVGTSNEFVLNFDNTPPPATAPITSYYDNFDPLQGDFLSGSTTNDTTPLLKGAVVGALAAGEVVVVYRDGVKLGNAVVTGSGWTYQDSGLVDGHAYSYTTRVEDAGGNQGKASDPFTLTVDTTAPPQTVSITGYLDDQGVNTGDFDFTSHPVTDDKTPLIKGSLSAGLNAGERVVIYRDGVEIDSATVTGTDWTYQDKDLDQGTGSHVYTAKVVDLAGNPGAVSNEATLRFEDLLDLRADDTVVHEAALPGGTGEDWLLDDGSATSDLTASGVFSLGSSLASLSITLGGQDAGLALADLNSLVGSKTVTVGGDTLVITNLGDGQYSYAYTLGAPKAHNTSGGNVGETKSNDFVITVTDNNGKTLSKTGGITVVNDEVRGDDKAFVIEMPDSASGVAITLVIDASGSMLIADGGTDPEGKPLNRWQQAKLSLVRLLDEYQKAYPAETEYEINIVLFDDILDYSGTFATIAEARAFVASAEMRGGGTYYSAGLGEAQQLVQQSMDNHPGWDQKVYFVTDGVPQDAGVPQAWKDFVSGANQDLIDVYGVALGDLVATPEAEAKIKAALVEGDVNDKFIPVKDPEDLADALLDTLPRVEGNLFDSIDLRGDAQSVALGGDGGFELSKVKIGDTVHVFGDQDVITVNVKTGLTMQIEKNGHYTVVTSLSHPDFTVDMTFDVKDADGDTATVTEQIRFFGITGGRTALALEASDTDWSGLLMDGGPMQIDLSALGLKAADAPVAATTSPASTNLAATSELLVDDRAQHHSIL